MKPVLLSILTFATAVAVAQSINRLDGTKITVEQADQAVRRLMEAASVTGMGVAILNENRPVWVRAYGWKNRTAETLLDTATVMYGASYSKAVFAVICLRLVEEGKLDLDRPLHEYFGQPIPERENYRELAGDDRWKRLTARICLSHTTGFPNWRFLNAHTGAFEETGKLAFYFEPGTRYAYSGEGLTLLQQVVETIMGKALQELARQWVFEPAGMYRSGYLWLPEFETNYAGGHDKGQVLLGTKRKKKANGAGSLVTTIADYARFIEALHQGRLLKKETFALMTTPQVAIHSRYQFPTISTDTADHSAIGLSYGLGWGLMRTPAGRAFFKEGHDNGWQHYNINFPEQGVSLIIMTNSDNGESIFRELLATLIGDTWTPWKWERYTPYAAAK